MAKSKLDKITTLELQNYINNSNSFQDVLRKIGYTQCNQIQTINRLKDRCNNENINYQHLINNNSQRQCVQCKQIKDITEYYFSNNKYSYTCKGCIRKQQNKKYHDRKELLDNYKSQQGCKKCGNNKFYLIEFHHINPNEKDYTIADATNTKLETLQQELDKCITLCCNCHREFHYLERENNITIQEYLGALE